MIGLEQGDQKVVHLSAEQAYGEFDQELVMEVPRADFAPDLELKPGLVFETENDEGQAVYFIVQEVKDDAVVIDFNHPLAGKDLEVTLSVRQVREATPEDLEGHEAHGGLLLLPLRRRRLPPPLNSDQLKDRRPETGDRGSPNRCSIFPGPPSPVFRLRETQRP